MLKRYNVKVRGNSTTLLLNDADAAALGLTEADVVPTKGATVPDKAATPANKARKTPNKKA